MKRPWKLWCVLLSLPAVLSFGMGAYHQTPLTEPSDTNGFSAASLSNAPLKRVNDHVFELGLVRLDKAKRTLSFPALVNMSEGVVEYAMVHSTGKVHESVLKTEADPLHIHLVRLLIGRPESAPKAGTPRELSGPRIVIWVQWRTDAETNRVRLEDMVLNTLTKTRMTRGEWVFNGSRVVQGTFIAHRDGSIVSIIADPDALVNNPRPGRDDDEIWRANNKLVPPVGTPVEVSFELASDRDTSTSAQ